MKNRFIKKLLNFLKTNWKKIAIVLIVVFFVYLLYPKYYFLTKSNSLIRCNKITGKCEVRRGTIEGGEWKTLK